MAGNEATVTVRLQLNNQGVVTGLQQVGQQGQRAGQQVSDAGARSTDSLARLEKQIMAVVSAIALKEVAEGFVKIAAEFERYNTQLVTITGSAAKAEKAMAWIKQFAKTTPYEVGQVTEAFIKLQAYGLDAPKWMKTLGDTASSMGKSLDQAVEMFADAATGEFERLKEFGVEAKTSGDEVVFSWSQNGKDMEVLAEKTQSGITGALGQIFTRFDGGMEKMSSTWEGMTSNMSDNWDAFRLAVMESGPFQAMKDGLKEFLDYLDSNQGKMDLATWANTTAIGVLEAFKTMAEGTKVFLDAIYGVRIAFGTMADLWYSLQKRAVKSNLDTALGSYSTVGRNGAVTVNIERQQELNSEVKRYSKALDEIEIKLKAANMMIDDNSQKVIDNNSRFDVLIGTLSKWQSTTQKVSVSGTDYIDSWMIKGSDVAAVAENIQKIDKKAEQIRKQAAAKAQREAERAAEEQKRIREQAADDYRKSILADIDYQKEQIQREYEMRKAAGFDIVELNRWKSREIDKLEAQRIDEFDKGFEAERKAAEEQTEKLKKEREQQTEDAIRALEEQRQAYKNFVYAVEYETAGFLESWIRGGFSSALDNLKSLLTSTIADIGSKALTEPIIVPVVQSFGGVIGSSLSKMLGIEGSTATTSGFNLSNIPGLVNALSGGMETGVYNALTSGILGNVGSKIFGSAAWSGTIGTELGWGAQAASATGMTTGGIAQAIAKAAPWAAIAAIAIPLISKIFESDPEPFLRVQTTSTSSELSSGNYNWGRGEGVSPAGFDYNLTMQDIGDSAREELGAAITKLIDAQFTAIEDTLDVSINDAIRSAQEKAGQYGAGFFSKIDLRDYEDDVEGALKALSEDLFLDIRDELVQQLTGASGTVFDSDFFSAIAVDGEEAVDTFLRFGQVVQSTDNFMEEFARQTDQFGESTYQAYQNVVTISGVMAQLSTAAASFTDNSSITALEEIDATYQGLIETLKAANAATEDLDKAESYRLHELGAQITGLTSTSVASALWDSIKNNQDASTFVATLEDQVRTGVAQAAVNAFSESLYSAFLGPMNSAIGGMVSQIISGGMTTGAALTASMATIKESLDMALALMKNEDFKSLIGTFMGEVSALMPTTPVVVATIPTADTSYTPSTTVAVDTTTEDNAAKLTDMMSDIKNAISDSMLDKYAAQIAKINRETQDNISTAVELGATERDLADIREWGSIQIAQALDEQESQLSDTMGKIRESISDSGMSDYIKKLYEISREMEGNISTAAELGATEQDLMEIRELATIKTQDVIDAFYDSVVSLAAVQEKINRASSIVDDQVLYYKIANLFDLPYDQIAQYSKQQLVDAFMQTDSLTWATTLEQMGINVDDFTSLMSKLVDSLKADNTRLESLLEAQAAISGRAEEYADQYRRSRLSDIFDFDFSNFTDAELVERFRELSEIDMQAMVSILGDNTEEFISIITEMADAVGNLSGIDKFEAGLTEFFKSIESKSAALDKAMIENDLMDIVESFGDFINNAIESDDILISKAEKVSESFQAVSSAGIGLAAAVEQAAYALTDNLNELFMTGFESSGVDVESQTDKFVGSLKLNLDAGYEALNEIASGLYPAVGALDDASNAVSLLQAQITTATGEEQDALTDLLNIALTQVAQLEAAITQAQSAINTPASILSAISDAMDQFQENIVEKAAESLSDDTLISALYPDLPTSVLASLSDVKVADENGYMDAFAKLIDSLTAGEIDSSIFTQAFELATKLFSGEITTDDNALSDIKDGVSSIYNDMLESVTDTVLTSTEKAKYEIVTTVEGYNEIIDQQLEAFNKIPVQTSDEYKEIAGILELAPDVIDRWARVKDTLIDIDNMQALGQTRAELTGRTGLWDINLLNQYFAGIDSLNTQQSIYSRWLTSSFSDIEGWAKSLGVSAEEFSGFMQTIASSVDRVSEVTAAKAKILGVSDQYTFAANEVAWGLEAGSLQTGQGRQLFIDEILAMSSEAVVEWTDSLGINTEDFISSIVSMSDNLRGANSEFSALADSMADYKKELLYQNNTISPEIIFKQALNSWQSNAAMLRSGSAEDVKNALSAFPSLSSNLLEAARQSASDQYEYNRVWGMILAESEQARLISEAQVTQSRDEAETIQRNWQTLIGVNRSQQEQNDAQIRAQNQLIDQLAVMQSDVESLARSADFDRFFAMFDSLFSPGAEWVESIRSEIEGNGTLLADIKSGIQTYILPEPEPLPVVTTFMIGSPASSSMANLSASSSDLGSDLRELASVVADIKDYIYRGTVSTIKTQQLLDEWDQNGLPGERDN